MAKEEMWENCKMAAHEILKYLVLKVTFFLQNRKKETIRMSLDKDSQQQMQFV